MSSTDSPSPQKSRTKSNEEYPLQLVNLKDKSRTDRVNLLINKLSSPDDQILHDIYKQELLVQLFKLS